MLSAPGWGAWGRTWRCHRRPWPWQSPGARRGPSRCTAAHNPSRGRALCGICGNHIWTERNVKKLQNSNSFTRIFGSLLTDGFCVKANCWNFPSVYCSYSMLWCSYRNVLTKMFIQWCSFKDVLTMTFLQRCSYENVLTEMFLQWCFYKDARMKMFLWKCSYEDVLTKMFLCRAHQYSRSSFQQYEAACRSPGSDNFSNQRNKTQLIRLKCKFCFHKPEDSKSIYENSPPIQNYLQPKNFAGSFCYHCTRQTSTHCWNYCKNINKSLGKTTTWTFYLRNLWQGCTSSLIHASLSIPPSPPVIDNCTILLINIFPPACFILFILRLFTYYKLE